MEEVSGGGGWVMEWVNVKGEGGFDRAEKKRTENTVGVVTPEPHVNAEERMAQGPLPELRVNPLPVSVHQFSISFDSVGWPSCQLG